MKEVFDEKKQKLITTGSIESTDKTPINHKPAIKFCSNDKNSMSDVEFIRWVKDSSKSLVEKIAKCQRLIHDDDDFYVAVDTKTNTYYICYRNLLMVDIDFYIKVKSEQNPMADEKNNQDPITSTINILNAYATKNKLTFAVYKTRNGIHAFLVSQQINRTMTEMTTNSYNDNNPWTIMRDLNCDSYYILYSYLRGWSVRLNRKKNEEIMKYDYLGLVGDEPIDEYLMELVNLHIKLVDQFKDSGPSLMFGN